MFTLFDLLIVWLIATDPDSTSSLRSVLAPLARAVTVKAHEGLLGMAIPHRVDSSSHVPSEALTHDARRAVRLESAEGERRNRVLHNRYVVATMLPRRRRIAGVAGGSKRRPAATVNW